MKKSPYGKYEAIKLYARQLRKEQTQAEKNFWSIVRRRQILGKRFLRQFAFEYDFNGRTHFFIVDFYCSEAKLVVEIEGGIHEKQQEYDTLRSEILKSQGLKFLRFKNDATKNPSYIIEKLIEFFRETI